MFFNANALYAMTIARAEKAPTSTPPNLTEKAALMASSVVVLRSPSVTSVGASVSAIVSTNKQQNQASPMLGD